MTNFNRNLKSSHDSALRCKKDNKSYCSLIRMTSNNNGFTLLELIITISIAGAILGFAAPSFRTLIDNNRIEAASNALIIAFKTARINAQAKGLPTFVCASNNADTAAPACGGRWDTGYLIFSKPANVAVGGGAGVFNPAVDTLIKQVAFSQNTTDGATIAATPAIAASSIGFQDTGFLWPTGAGTPNIVICDSKRGADKGKFYQLTLSGNLIVTDTNDPNVVAPACGTI